jgi:hypothetical protein
LVIERGLGIKQSEAVTFEPDTEAAGPGERLTTSADVETVDVGLRKTAAGGGEVQDDAIKFGDRRRR